EAIPPLAERQSGSVGNLNCEFIQSPRTKVMEFLDPYSPASMLAGETRLRQKWRWRRCQWFNSRLWTNKFGNTFFSKRRLMRRAASGLQLMKSDTSAGNGKDDWAISY